MNEEFYQALEDLEKERGIPKDYMLEKIRQALTAAYHRENPTAGDNVEFAMDPETSVLQMFAVKTVVEEVTDPTAEILHERAKALPGYSKCAIGDIVKVRLETKSFTRIAAQTAKQVIIQGIRESERGAIYREFASREQEILNTQVYKIDRKTGAVILTIAGKNEEQTLLLAPAEQIKGEIYSEGQHLKVYLVGVMKGVAGNAKTAKGPQLQISRTHPGFIRKLFESEVPEVYDGTVEIVSVAREAGSRTKIAVRSNDEAVEPVGACVGPKGARVNNVVDEIAGEKIDIIKYSEDPAEYVAAALAPATVLSSVMSEDGKVCEVMVPDDQLSLAIGREGQNARLAAKLTGYKIDIRSKSFVK
ncbi:MAG: transcription termination/antitermination protein NusA [Ruminococcaceae bacterium]|nr:transcription termination/antitermination protein NusA [Oscillospiraceae bacterium]MBQ8899204.1 transcription termination/antitermination protein NusA [Clostridia bacterium]